MNPKAIAWTLRETRLGLLLVAASERGVCHVRFGDDADELRRALETEFAYAPLRRDEGVAGGWADALARYADGESRDADVPLDVAGSRFQRRVWDALRTIPSGERRSYAEVAAQVGQPRAARAVARACATNPVPLAVPCHRVVPAAGGVGGYRYGSWRKSALLDAEAAPAGLRAPEPAASPVPR